MPISYIAVLFLGLSSSGISSEAASDCVANSPVPELVLPGIVSQDDRHEFGVTLSQDCKELFVGIEHGEWVSIERYVHSDDGWQFVERVLGSEEASTNDPYLSADGQRLYFILRQNDQHDIAYIERQGANGWSTPRILEAPVNTSSNEFYTSFDRNGDLIFSSNRDATRRGDYNIYRARRESNGYAEVQPFPEGINTKGYEADPFIDPDGDFLLFASNRRGGKGRGDIYVSFHTGNQEWTPPQPLEVINTAGHELCPYITADGSTLYYTSNQDIYRIDASIIDALRPKDLPGN